MSESNESCCSINYHTLTSSDFMEFEDVTLPDIGNLYDFFKVKTYDIHLYEQLVSYPFKHFYHRNYTLIF